MANNRKVLIGVGAAIALGAIATGIVIFVKGNSAKNKTTSGASSGGTTASTTSSSGGGFLSSIFGGGSSGFPIGIGASGSKVKDIQNYVNSTNILSTPLTVDGQFGPLTASGVQATGFSVPVTQDEYNQMTASYNYTPDPSLSGNPTYPSIDNSSPSQYPSYTTA